MSSRAKPVLVFDGDCAFCFKCVRVIAVMLALPHAQLLPAQQNRRADSLMRAQQSWVVIDHDDSAHLKGVALLRLMQRSPLLGWARGALRVLQFGGIIFTLWAAGALDSLALAGIRQLDAPLPPSGIESRALTARLSHTC